MAEAKAKAAKTDTKAAKPAKEGRIKIEQNGINRPSPDTTTGKVWEIADKISTKLKAPAPRGDVLKEAEALGINAATASTQYGKWRKFNGLKAEPKAPKEKAAAKPKAVAKTKAAK